MRPLPALFALLLISSIALAAEPTCISCEELAGKLTARINSEVDSNASTLTVNVYYENLSANTTRQPISDYLVIIQLTNSTGLNELYKSYTDSQGQATMDFSDWKDGCINFKILYCPFCSPESPTCGFAACMNYSGIQTTATSAGDILVAPGSGSEPGTLNNETYLPGLDQQQYCPPPKPLSETPALCLPLLIIFSLLSGSLYLIGRNPFAGFNIGGARIGKHIRYQARGRGFALDLKSAAMSIYGAAGELKAEKGADGKETGRRAGEGTRPTYFGYSLFAGGGGASTRDASGRVLAAGGGRTKGIIGILGGLGKTGGEIARAGRAATVRTFGGQERDKSGKVIGREFGAGRVTREWGTDFGLGLARMAVALWDSSWIGSMAALSDRLEGAVRRSERETRAAFIADCEHAAAVYGRDVRDAGVRFREGSACTSATATGCTREDTDGSVTGRPGARYLDLGAVTLADGTTGRSIITEPPTIDDHGNWRATVSVISGEGDSRRVTNYTMTNGAVTSFEQVLRPGQVDQIGVVYRLGEGGRVEVAGINSYTGVSGEARFSAVTLDAQGRISSIGDITIQRNERGEVTGMFDRSIPGERGTPGMRIGDTSAMGIAISGALANNGQNISAIAGLARLDNAGMQNLAMNTQNTLNSNCERTREVYMEQFGLVRVTEGDLIGTRSADGTVTRDASTYDAKITVIDPNYSPSGEAVTRTGLAAGTSITVENGQYTGATGADGRAMPIETREIRGPDGRIERVDTVVGGTSVVLNRGLSRDTGAGGVRDHMGGLNDAMGNIQQSWEAYRPHLVERLGESYLAAHPGAASAFAAAMGERGESGDRFATAMRSRGLRGEALDAAGMLYESVHFGGTETRLAGETERAKGEYERAFTRALLTGDHRFDETDIAAMSPRAQEYMRARDALPEGVDPSSAEGRRMIEGRLQPALDRIANREYEAIRLAASDNPADRSRGEEALRTLGLVPRDARPAEGERLVDLAIARSVRADDAGTAGVVRERVHDRVDDVMRSRPDLVVGSIGLRGGGDEAEFANRVAGHVLGIGTELSGMSDGDIRSRASAAIAADPSIRTEADRARAMELVDSMMPRAREVATNFAAAERAMVAEVSSAPYNYMTHDTDMRYASMAHEMMDTTPRPPPAPDSEMAARFTLATVSAEHPEGLRIDSPDGRREWDRMEADRIHNDGFGFVTAASRHFGSLPPDASRDDRERAMGEFLLRYADNPDAIGMSAHHSALAYAAIGPGMDGIDRMRAGTHTVSLDSAASDYAPTTTHVNLAGTSGYVVGSAAATSCAAAYGSDVPRDVYTSAAAGMRAYHDGDYQQAQLQLSRSAVLASVYSDAEVRGHESVLDTARRGRAEAEAAQFDHRSEEFTRLYEEERTRFKRRTGINVGDPGIPGRPEVP